MSLRTALSEASFTQLISYTCLTAVVLLMTRWIRAWYRLRHIPGPASAGWSVWWQLSGALGGKYHERLKTCVDEYGPLVRIGPNELLSADPEILRRIASARGAYTKGDFYTSGRVVPGIDNVVSTRGEAEHKALRAQMAPAFASRGVEGSGLEAGIDRQLVNFFHLLARKYVSDSNGARPFDMAEKTQFLALDIIGDISLGKPFGYLAKDEDLYNYNQINHSSLPVMNVVSVLPWLTDIIHQWPLSLVLPSEGDKVGFGRLMGFVRGFVEKRMESKEQAGKDMMQISIDNGMGKNDLIQQGFIAIIAGSNSTAHTLQMTLLSLTTSPCASQALVREIQGAAATVSSPISWAETQNLPYLQAVVREGLRMWPPVSGLGFKRVPPGGDTINGYFVPQGTDVGQAFFAVGRSKAIWGDDADVFRPERWLTASEADLKVMTAAVDTHFGAGKFACLGKPIALMELHKTIFELMRRYDISVVNAERPIKTQTSVFLFASEFFVTINERTLSSS